MRRTSGVNMSDEDRKKNYNCSHIVVDCGKVFPPVQGGRSGTLNHGGGGDDRSGDIWLGGRGGGRAVVWGGRDAGRRVVCRRRLGQ